MPIYKGQTKIVKLYKGTTQIVKRYKGTDLIYSASRLPAEFQEVEYIESTGTQYIDTNAIQSNVPDLDNILFVSLVCRYTEINNNFRQGRSGNRVAFGISNSQFYFGITNQNLTLGTADTNTHTFFINTSDLSYGYDSNIAYKSDLSPQIASSYPFYLFARAGSGGVAESFSKCAVYKCSIKINNILIRDFVPCYRKADNIAGLYDLVNGVFYTNAGTGTFIVGGNV